MTPKQKKIFEQGTPFQQKVWKELSKIPSGQTRTYAEIAKKIGKPTAVRAVANAIGANNLPVIVPCHRVIRSDGGLGGYRWGIAKKKKLLAMEMRGAK
jgi:AraC family transcriptional regulator of adaptative response/methylated-DNA-[protein]-cysteine methyltransferase